jgi:hypothetical protein
VPAKLEGGTRCGGLHRCLFCPHSLYRSGARPATTLPAVRLWWRTYNATSLWPSTLNVDPVALGGAGRWAVRGRGRTGCSLGRLLVASLVLFPFVSREQPEPLRNPPETTLESTGPELDVEATAEEEAATTLAEPGPQPCLHISISGSGLEMEPGPAKGDPQPELVPFDSDSDDESSPSPSGTLQSQASQSTISSSFGSECGVGIERTASEGTPEEAKAGVGSLGVSFYQVGDGNMKTQTHRSPGDLRVQLRKMGIG